MDYMWRIVQRAFLLANLLLGCAHGYVARSGTCSHLLSSINGMYARTRESDAGNFVITSNVPAGGYVGGVEYDITVSNGGSNFNGLLLYAVADSSSNAPEAATRMGQFTITQQDNHQLLSCSPGPTITHKSSTGKQSVVAKFVAPADGTGGLTFYGIGYVSSSNAFHPLEFKMPASVEVATGAPSLNPTSSPTSNPTTLNPTEQGDTPAPTAIPTNAPSANPTAIPTNAPSANPTVEPQAISPPASIKRIVLDAKLSMRYGNSGNGAMWCELVYQGTGWVGIGVQSGAGMISSAAVLGSQDGGVEETTLQLGTVIRKTSLAALREGGTFTQEGGVSTLTFQIDVALSGIATAKLLWAYGDSSAVEYHANRGVTAFGEETSTTASPTPISLTDDEVTLPGFEKAAQLEAGVILGWNLKPDEGLLDFSVQRVGQAAGWLSFGFSSQGFMAGSDAVVGAGGAVQAWKLTSYSQSEFSQKGAGYLEGSPSFTVQDGNAQVFGARKLKTDDLAGDVQITDVTQVSVIWAYHPSGSFPADQHAVRGSATINLQSGAASTDGDAELDVVPVLPVFLACLLVLAAGALLNWSSLRRTCRTCHFKRPCNSPPADLTVAQWMMLLCLYCAVVASVLLKAGRPQGSPIALVTALGMASSFCIGMAALPITRNSLWLPLFGIPFERAVRIHRIMGRASFLAVLSHGASVAVKFEPATLVSAVKQGPADHQVTPLFGFIVAVCLLLTLVLTNPKLRRCRFEVFYYLHFPLFTLIWVFSLLHVQNMLHLACLVIPIMLYFVDILARCVKQSRRWKLVSSEIIAGATRITLSGPPTEFEAGSYCFLSFPSLSSLQSHPFSISSPPGAEHMTFHIKDMGEGTFTRSLQAHLKDNKNSPVKVEGPYGRVAMRVEEYKSVVLVSGGVGITPMASIAQDLLNKKLPYKRIQHIHFIWVIQQPDQFEWFPELLSQLQDNPNVTVSLYCTRFKGEEGESVVPFTKGRPDMASLLKARLSNAPEEDGDGTEMAEINGVHGAKFFARDTCVLACGPARMVAAAQSLATKLGIDFHKETFAL